MLNIIKEQEVLGKVFKVYGTFENPLFLAKDVAEWIEHSNSRMMLQSVNDEEKECVNNPYALQGQQEQWFLTEDGLYEVLMQSRKPIAKDFKKEVKKILKEIRVTGSFSAYEMSPQLQLLIHMEQEQQRQALQIANANRRIDNMKEVIALDTRSWRQDAKSMIAKIALTFGDYSYIKEVQTMIYQLLEQRANVNLSIRLTNKRRRMSEEGATKSKRDKVTKVDIIADDKKLIEIYVAIVKEMAVKYGIEEAV